MKNLARHIEFLLRNNDCVILPGVGGFVVRSVPAYYVSEEHLYYPPSRSISFNAALTMNDGLLAQSYMQAHKINYAQACHLIDIALDRLFDSLDEEGIVTLPHIGTLQQDIHGTLQFTSEVVAINSPQLFGLSSFTIHDLAELEHKAHQAQGIKYPESIITQSEKTINVHINKGFLRRVMSTAAVFILLLMVSIPTGKHQLTNVASLNLSSLTVSLTPSTEYTEPTISEQFADPAPIGIKNEEVAEETTTVAPIATLAPSTDNVVTHPDKLYHIIIASLPNHRGAEETLERYAAKGYDDISLVERDNRVRVSLTHFADKDEANEFLKTLRNDPEFHNAWLLAVRNN